MADFSIAGVSSRTFKVTTVSASTSVYPEDLVERHFDPEEPDALWLSDLT